MILGQKGYGKTQLARKIAASQPRVLIHDTTKRDYGGGVVLREADEIYDHMREVKNHLHFSVIVRPADERATTACFAVCRHVLNLTLVVDEADRFCTSQKSHPDLRYLINEGRHDGVNLVLVARRPHRLNIDALSQADCIVCHRIQGAGDRDTLKDFFGQTDLLNLGRFEWRRYRDTPLIHF